MAEKKYYWLKLKEDFFEDKQIKYLRSLPDGDKIVIAYLKMQLKSLKTEGFVKYDKILPSNIEELSMILDEDINVVKLMVGALEKVGAIEELDDGSFYMIAMQDLIGKEGDSAERVRQFRHREKQKALQCNTNVTKCNIEIEKEIEIEKRDREKRKELDIDIDIEKEDLKEKEVKPNRERIDYKEFANTYNKYCTKLSAIVKLTEKRKESIRKFLKEYTLEDFEEICKLANNNKFLTGDNDRNWKADFDFLIRIDKATSILEGKYKAKRSKINDFFDIYEEAINNEQARDNESTDATSWELPTDSK